jgi:hypothetical protein
MAWKDIQAAREALGSLGSSVYDYDYDCVCGHPIAVHYKRPMMECPDCLCSDCKLDWLSVPVNTIRQLRTPRTEANGDPAVEWPIDPRYEDYKPRW